MREEASGIKVKAFFSKFPFLQKHVQKKGVYAIDFESIDLTEAFLDRALNISSEEEIYFFDKNGEEILRVGIGSCSKKSLFVRIVRCFVSSRIKCETVGGALERALKKNKEVKYVVVLFPLTRFVCDVHVMQLREKFSEALVEKLVNKRLEEIEALRWLHEEA